MRGPPQNWLIAQPQPVREFFTEQARVVRESESAIASASGELLGREDVAAVIPADFVGATVADLRAEVNTLLAALRGLIDT